MQLFRHYRLVLGSLVGISLLQLSGCAAVVVGSVGVSAVTMSEDKRTIGTQIDDSTTDSKIESAISKISGLDKQSHINVHVYNGNVLLMGQAPTDNLKAQADKITRSVPITGKVYNQIRVSNPTSATTRAYDVWLASKIRANLISSKKVDFLKMDVAVEDSEVFLMGLVTQDEANNAVEITRNIDGVIKVINMFEIN